MNIQLELELELTYIYRYIIYTTNNSNNFEGGIVHARVYISINLAPCLRINSPLQTLASIMTSTNTRAASSSRLARRIAAGGIASYDVRLIIYDPAADVSTAEWGGSDGECGGRWGGGYGRTWGRAKDGVQKKTCGRQEFDASLENGA